LERPNTASGSSAESDPAATASVPFGTDAQLRAHLGERLVGVLEPVDPAHAVAAQQEPAPHGVAHALGAAGHLEVAR
jgi:hypothetical protein